VVLDDGSQSRLRPPADRHRLVARQPPIPGIAGPGVHSCWTLADARAIMALAKPGARVLQMGAGFIGCIIMEALAARGVQAQRGRDGRPHGAAHDGPHRRRHDQDLVPEPRACDVHTGAPRRIAIEKRDAARVMKVKLSTGEVLEPTWSSAPPASSPTSASSSTAGVRCLVGVLTDEHLQTNVPGIYAAGDCAEAFDKVSGKTIVSAIQPNAAEQARVAALNMVGQRTELKGVTQINVLDTLGLISASFGQWDGVPGGQHVELTDRAAGRT
jgi:NAD(P)H-nitrite reductase large subunit